MHIDFHLVIPAFKESGRLPPYLSDLAGQLKGKDYRTTILVVDDGSGPQEQARLREVIGRLQPTSDLILDPLFLERNMGKGYAVRRGWQAGKSAKWLAFADADGATPAYDVARVFDSVYRDNDARRSYFGVRVRMLGRAVKRPILRHTISRMYAGLVGMLINDHVYDSQCGFKLLSGEAFAAIGDLLQENRFAFDSELIAALSEAGYPLEEVPVDWKDIPGTKLSFFRDSTRMVTSLFAIHKRLRSGGYRATANPAGLSSPGGVRRLEDAAALRPQELRSHQKPDLDISKDRS